MYIKKRTEEITNKQILSFRAPTFKINGNTIRALDEAGFKIVHVLLATGFILLSLIVNRLKTIVTNI